MGQQSEDQLIAQYAPLVRRQALGLLGRLPANVELDDLMQAGMLGLLDALRRYEERPEAQFETYAVTRIRGAMLDELRSQDWMPRSTRSKARQIEEAVRALHQRLLRAPTELELAAELELPLEDYRQLLLDAHGVQVLMAEDLRQANGVRQGTPSQASPLEMLGDEQAPVEAPLEQLVRRGLRAALIGAIEELPEREQLLLSLQFEQDLNQKEIALVLEVSEGRVSQLRSQAIARIRAWLQAHDWSPDAADLRHGKML